MQERERERRGMSKVYYGKTEKEMELEMSRDGIATTSLLDEMSYFWGIGTRSQIA